MVAPGSNRGKPHLRGRGGGQQATGLLTASGRHAPLEASICKEALGTLHWLAAEKDSYMLRCAQSSRYNVLLKYASA